MLDRLNNLKQLRSEDEVKLRQLSEIKANISGLSSASIKLNELYLTALDNLKNCTEDNQRLAFDALDI